MVLKKRSCPAHGISLVETPVPHTQMMRVATTSFAHEQDSLIKGETIDYPK